MPTTREFEGTTIHCWESGTGHALVLMHSSARVGFCGESLLAWLPSWN
ncbi:MAG TPA: hypothetical protein VEV61_18885 [Streptosporangiaceae bacterium]|nr:hypothetical protein [Streptosporangiaceae bacterium]